MKKTVMVILGKGFSSRIPKKNLKDFCGYPLIVWSLVQAANARHIDETWVTTDSEDIATVAEKYGAKVMFRRYQDTDETPGSVPMTECVRRLVDEERVLADDDWVIGRLCTNPALLPGDVDRFVERYMEVRRAGGVGLGVGADQRTMIIAKRVVPGKYLAAPREWQSHNDYSIVDVLAFMGMTQASAWREKPQMLPDYHKPQTVSNYCAFEPWQMQDTDTLEEWEFAELVVEHYILKGRDMIDVYTRKEDEK